MYSKEYKSDIYDHSHSILDVKGENKMFNLKFFLITHLFNMKSGLKQRFGRKQSRQIMNKMKIHYVELSKRWPKQKAIMEFHRMFLMAGLSLYRALQDELGKKDDLVEIVHQSLWKGLLRKNIELQAFFIRRSKNPYDNFLKHLGPRNEWFFPCPPWEKTEIKLDNGVGWNQTKCPMYDFFKKENVLELTRAYCDLDSRITELVPDHIELKRQRTLANGDEWCDFYYYQK